MEHHSYPETGQLQASNTAALAKAFLNKVYLWMAGCMLLTAGVAAYCAQDLATILWVQDNQGLIAIGTIVMVVIMSFGTNLLSAGALTVLLLAFAGIQGLLFGPLLLAYKLPAVTKAFACTAVMFGAMSIYGATTKRNLGAWGRGLLMMLIGLIVATIINIFWGNGIMDFIISCVGIVIFSCFTAYHTQSLLELGTCEDETVRAKGAVMGALALYLDFINLFLILLRFFGGRDE